MKFRQWLTKIMYGRYGADELNRALSIAAVILVLLSMIFRGKVGSFLWALAVVTLFYQLFRTLSKNTVKRRAENQVYLRIRGIALSQFTGAKTRFSQRKDYRFFRCKKCGAYMRVPRGKGKVRIRCSKCGSEFEAKA